MNDSDFDPYHKWLGIPPKAQPPNHYRLLSVELFESDPDVIDSAAQRQITHVRSFALGKHAEQSQSILNELAKARVVLLDPAAKAKYDAWLNAQRKQSATVPSPPDAVDNAVADGGPSLQIDSPTAPVTPRRSSQPTNRLNQSSKLVPWGTGFVGLLLAGLLFVWLLSGPKQPVVADFPVGEQPSQDVRVVEEQDEVQPSQPSSGLDAILDSAQLSVGVIAEDVVEQRVEVMELDVASETTLPPEPEEAPADADVVSSEPSDANKTPRPAIAPFGAQQAKEYQDAWAEHFGLDVEVTNSIGMNLRVIPAGTFMMGSEDGRENEKPVHSVTLTKSFLLGVYEVAQSEYQQVMGVNPSEFNGSRSPVVKVSWDDANEFCRRLSLQPEEQRAGRVYRLPTEAEWGFACRAGTTTKYSYGDDESLLSRYGWYVGNKARSLATPNPVGSKIANPFGLHDMHGNVWEWCKDWYRIYASDDVTNPTGPLSGSHRVVRGGSWRIRAEACRSAVRSGSEPSNRYVNSGFRVACVPSGQ